jgi:O-antigen/teichoic acid export membrane protein
MIADFGLTNIVVREITRAKDRVGEILGATIPLVSLLAIAGYGLIVCAGEVLDIARDTRLAMYIMGASVLVSFHAAVYGSVCRAFEEMGLNAAVLVSQRIVLLVLVLAGLYTDAGLPRLAACFLGERLFQWTLFRLLIWRRYTRYTWRLDGGYWRYLLREGLPVGAGMVLRRISWQVNIFMLSALSTAALVGFYSAANRVVHMLNVIPFTLSVPVFPLLSRVASRSPERAVALYERAQRALVLIGVPVGVWIAALGTQVVLMVFGEAYERAGVVLQLLGPLVILLFANSLLVFICSALGMQRLFMAAAAICIVANVVLDLLLIPLFDIRGAALGSVGAELLFFATGSFLLGRQGLKTSVTAIFTKPLIAGLLAGSVLIWPATQPGLSSFVLGSLGFVAVFLVAAFFLRLLGEVATFADALPLGGKRRIFTMDPKRGDR